MAAVPLRQNPATDTLSILTPSFPSPLLAPRWPHQGPPRIPEAHSLDDVIQYWEEGAPDKGLVVPLANWCVQYNPKEYRSEAQKYSMMGILYDEFTMHCGSDWDTFKGHYPDLHFSYTKLIAAVWVARIARGDAKSRKRRAR